MARTLYGGSGADVIAQVSIDDGDLEPGSATFDVYTARTSGTHVTDLLDGSSSPITEVEPDADGRVLFYGVDGYSGPYYLQDQAAPSAERWLVLPSNLPLNVADLLARVDDLEAGGVTGTVNLADVVGLVAALAALQPMDADLTTIAGLSHANDTLLQTKSSAWAARTPAQVAADMGVASSSTQTLTNKTIDGDDNALQNIPQSAVTGLEDAIGGIPALGLPTVVWDGTTYGARSTSGTIDPTVPVLWLFGPGPSLGGSGSTGAIGGVDIYGRVI